METFKQGDALLNLKMCCAKYLSLAKIFGDLNLNDLPYANIKGDILSLYAFSQYGQRIYGDIDILVSRKNLHIIEDILLQYGYMTSMKTRAEKVLMLSASHQTATWCKVTSRNFKSVVDVNFDLFWGEYTGKRIDIDRFLADAIEMDVYGVRVKALSPLKAMVQLILHHYKEMNSIYLIAQHGTINYRMFRDVYFLWKNNVGAILLNDLYALCSEYEIVPYVFYILYYTNEIFKDHELSKYIDAFRTSEGVDLLDYYGLADYERKLWKVDFKSRLETENLYDLIKNDLTELDLEKVDRNRMIFG